MRDMRFAGIVLFVFALVGAFLAVVFVPFLDARPLPAEVMAPSAPRGVLPGATYLPPAPGEAPEGLREVVLRGRELFTGTGQALPGYVGNGLTCNSCHFEAGVTRGGRNGSLSLVGTAARWPREHGGRILDLPGRINECVVDSLRGQPLPTQGPEMIALVAWLTWISRGVPIHADVPWMGVPPMPETPKADPEAGQGVFIQRCAMCHGLEGQGTAIAPALWGPRSFSSDAGMARAEVMAPFTYNNMPREAPFLTPGEAAHVAAYVLGKERP